MKMLKWIVMAAALAAAPACKSKEEPKPATTATATATATGSSATPTSASNAAGSTGSAAAGSADTATPSATADFISVFAEHAEKKPNDPVEVKFERFTVKSASFDPQKIEGGTATIEVDLTSANSGAAKRDKHLATADYIDTAKFATMTIDVSNVKQQQGTTYAADAKVSLRGIEKTYPITFEVLEAKDDWIRVKGEHKFQRMDFKVGKEQTGPDESVAHDLTIKLQLTLKKS